MIALQRIAVMAGKIGHSKLQSCHCFAFAEVVKSHLPDFLDWAVRIVASKECDPDSVSHQLGALAALSAIYKHGKREDLKTEASTVLKVRTRIISRFPTIAACYALLI